MCFLLRFSAASKDDNGVDSSHDNAVDYEDDDDFESVWNDLSAQKTDQGAKSFNSPAYLEDALDGVNEDADGLIETMDDGSLQIMNNIDLESVLSIL